MGRRLLKLLLALGLALLGAGAAYAGWVGQLGRHEAAQPSTSRLLRLPDGREIALTQPAVFAPREQAAGDRPQAAGAAAPPTEQAAGDRPQAAGAVAPPTEQAAGGTSAALPSSAGDAVAAAGAPLSAVPAPAGAEAVPGAPPPAAAPTAAAGAPPATVPDAAVLLPPERLHIPAIGVEWPVVLGDNDNLPAFSAVAWMFGSGFPGRPGNMVLFGHLGGPHGTLMRLHELRPGDEFSVQTAAGALRYRVRRSYETTPDDVTALLPSDTPIATLITCSGPWDALAQTNARRLIVVADYVQP